MKNRKLAFFMAATFTAAGILQSGLPVCAEEPDAEEVIFEENGTALETYDNEEEICAEMDIPETGKGSGSDSGDVKEAEKSVPNLGERVFDTDIVVEMVEETADSDLELQAGEDVVINDINFPDDAFRQKVSEICDTGEKDGILTEAERIAVTELKVGNEDIESLDGIRYFPELTKLVCNDNRLTDLDLSGNEKLTYLDCSWNYLSSLNLSGNMELTYLDCEQNALTSLDVSGNKKLIFLNCSGNALTSLDVSENIHLKYWSCRENRLTSLVVGPKEELEALLCYYNHLAALDLSGTKTLGEEVAIKDQTITVSAALKGGSWKVNMAEVVGSANVGRIRKADLTPYGGADWDGMIDLGSGEHPNTNAFTYYYETQASNPYSDLPQSTKYMEVQVTVQEVPHTHRWTEWGTVSPASLTAPEQQQRSCPDCGSVETRSVGEKLQPQPQIQMNCGTSVLPITLKHSIKLTAFGLSEGDTVVSWRSSNTKVAAVSKNGKVTAKKTGTATITVTTKTGATASVKVKVQKKAVATKKISITAGKTASVKQGKTKAIKTKITPITSLDKVKFSSSDKKVVSVNSRGVIKGVKKGKATITAKSGKKKAKIQVTVK